MIADCVFFTHSLHPYLFKGKRRQLKAGDVLQIPAGTRHGIKALTDLELMEVVLGKDLAKEDVIRIEMVW